MAQNRALAFANLIKPLEMHLEALKAFVALMETNPTEAKSQYNEAKKLTNKEVVVNNNLDMLIELAYNNWKIVPHIIYHRVALDITSGVPKITQCFNVEKTADESVCNLIVANKMNKGELFFQIGVSIDFYDEILDDELQRLEKGAVLKIIGHDSTEYFKRKISEIPGGFKHERFPTGAGAGAVDAANPDVLIFSRGDGTPFYTQRFLKWGEDQKLEHQFDVQDSTATLVEGDAFIAYYGFYASNKK